MSGKDEMLPPKACQVLSLVCEECPFLDCMEDLRQESDPGNKKGNMLLARWQGKWPSTRVEYVGRLAYVEQTNTWLRETVLPEAHKVLAGESAILGRHQARVLVSILGSP